MQGDESEAPFSGLSRRSFLALGLGTLATTLLAGPVQAAVQAKPKPKPKQERSLHLYNIHDRSSLHLVYWSKGRYIPKAVAQISRFMRDSRSGEVHAIDPRLMDLMVAVQKKVGATGPLHVVCGYRSPHSNAIMASASTGVAHHSLHMSGRAVDIRIPGKSVRAVARAAISLKAGGVGSYPSSNFVHIDTGPVRYW